MRVLLVRPFVDATIGNAPPLSLLYLSAAVKDVDGVSVEVFDNIVEGKLMGLDQDDADTNPAALEQFLRDLEKRNPDMIGMTLYTRELSQVARLCELIKERMPRTMIVLGGPHPTACPRETVEQIPECSVAVIGEGEVTLRSLLMALIEKIHTPDSRLQTQDWEGEAPAEPLLSSVLSPESISSVKGICFRKDCDIVATGRPQILNADEFPVPDRSSVIDNYRLNRYNNMLYGSPVDNIMTSRGCLFNCSFCFKVCKRYRASSPERVMEEIEWVYQNIRPRFVEIMDDSFTLQEERCSAILDYLIERQYPIHFKVRSRVDAVNLPLLQKMREAGVKTITFGLESGSQTMLDAFRKRTTVEQNIRACHLARKAGLACHGDMILFFPGETRQTLAETQSFLRIARPTGVKFYVLSPLPGTAVYERAKREENLVGDWRVGEESPWVKIPAFSDCQEMNAIAKQMFLKYYTEPFNAVRLLKSYAATLASHPSTTYRMVKANIFKTRRY